MENWNSEPSFGSVVTGAVFSNHHCKKTTVNGFDFLQLRHLRAGRFMHRAMHGLAFFDISDLHNTCFPQINQEHCVTWQINGGLMWQLIVIGSSVDFKGKSN